MLLLVLPLLLPLVARRMPENSYSKYRLQRILKQQKYFFCIPAAYLTTAIWPYKIAFGPTCNTNKYASNQGWHENNNDIIYQRLYTLYLK